MKSEPIHALPSSIPLIKILVVESNQSLLHGICADLEQIGYQAICAEDNQTAVKLFESDNPDLIILDVNIPPAAGHSKRERLGIDFVKDILAKTPNIGVVFYTSTEKYAAEVQGMFERGKGGMGYVSKDAAITLLSILPSVLAGCWVCILTRRDLLKEISEEIFLVGLSESVKLLILEASRRIDTLTKDEIETLRLLGESNCSIAKRLDLKIGSVEARLKNIYLKLGLEQVDRRLRAILVDRALNLHNWGKRLKS